MVCIKFPPFISQAILVLLSATCFILCKTGKQEETSILICLLFKIKTLVIWGLYYYLLQGDFKSRAEQAVQAGEQFCDLYYDTFDKKRHVGLWMICFSFYFGDLLIDWLNNWLIK